MQKNFHYIGDGLYARLQQNKIQIATSNPLNDVGFDILCALESDSFLNLINYYNKQKPDPNPQFKKEITAILTNVVAVAKQLNIPLNAEVTFTED